MTFTSYEKLQNLVGELTEEELEIVFTYIQLVKAGRNPAIDHVHDSCCPIRHPSPWDHVETHPPLEHGRE